MNVIRSLYLDFETVANELGNDNLITDDLFEATLGEHGVFLTKSVKQSFSCCCYFPNI